MWKHELSFLISSFLLTSCILASLPGVPSSFLTTHWKLALLVFHILQKVCSDYPKPKWVVLHLNSLIKWKDLSVNRLDGRGGSQALGDGEASQVGCLVVRDPHHCSPPAILLKYFKKNKKQWIDTSAQAVGALPIIPLYCACQLLLTRSTWNSLVADSLALCRAGHKFQGTNTPKRNPQQRKNESLWINSLVSSLLRHDNSERCSTQPSRVSNGIEPQLPSAVTHTKTFFPVLLLRFPVSALGGQVLYKLLTPKCLSWGSASERNFRSSIYFGVFKIFFGGLILTYIIQSFEEIAVSFMLSKVLILFFIRWILY